MPRPTVMPPGPPPLPRRRRRGSGAVTIGALVAAALVAGVAVGGAVHLLPQSASTSQVATGVLSVTSVGDGEDPDATVASGMDAGRRTDSAGEAVEGGALTSFVTSCGEVLDVVASEAVATADAVRVSLEVRPVCPTGELFSTDSVTIDLLDLGVESTTGNVPSLAVGTFDLSRAEVLVPGFGDAPSTIVAEFGPGAAWTTAEDLERRILDGVVGVECRTATPAEGTRVTAEAASRVSRVEVTAVPAAGGTGLEATALAALKRQARADDASVSAIEGSWVPQLSSKTNGTFDAFDGRSYSNSAIYEQFLALRLRYPNVRLLYSTDWDAYALDGYWVVIAGVPFIRSAEPNGWCADRDIDPTQCFAKLLVRDGAPPTTTRLRS